jgi:ATP-dependent Zn protease
MIGEILSMLLTVDYRFYLLFGFFGKQAGGAGGGGMFGFGKSTAKLFIKGNKN